MVTQGWSAQQAELWALNQALGARESELTSTLTQDTAALLYFT